MAKVFPVLLMLQMATGYEPAPEWQTDPATGKQYTVLTDDSRGVQYKKASALCSSVLGILPEPRSREENTFLNEDLRGADGRFYLGMRDAKEEGNWTWDSDRSDVSWMNWQTWNGIYTAEPNGEGDCVIVLKEAAHYLGHWYDQDKWADVRCSHNVTHVVCEKNRLCEAKLTECYNGLRNNVVKINVTHLCMNSTRASLATCMDRVECDTSEEHQKYVRYFGKLNDEYCSISGVNWTHWDTASTPTCKNSRSKEADVLVKFTECNECRDCPKNGSYCEIDHAYACWINEVPQICGPPPFSDYYKEVIRATLRALKATIMKSYTEEPSNCTFTIL